MKDVGVGLLLMLTWFVACSDTPNNTSAADAGADSSSANATADSAVADTTSDSAMTDATNAPPLELTPDLCDDASNMAVLTDSLSTGGSNPTYGKLNTEQVLKMVQAPTEGPFYMVNLIRFRDKALYTDGRETQLTGREANALYSPTEFISAIGAKVVFVGNVQQTITGTPDDWDEVAIVEYPCPLALFAMTAHPEFQARSVHKDAGVEASIVMVTHLQPLEDTEPKPSPFPATTDDPAFELVQINRYAEQAQYPDPSKEPSRTGQDAMALYLDGTQAPKQQLGIYPKAHLKVQGVFIGDERTWDEVRIDFVPSNAAFKALTDNPAVAALQHHFDASLAESYGLVTHPLVSTFTGQSGGGGLVLPPVTSDGTGTLCQTDQDCPGNGVEKCFKPTPDMGFCSREGCSAGQCEAPYVCCGDCSTAVAPMLPFKDSLCLPNAAVAQLTAAPALCTCN